MWKAGAPRRGVLFVGRRSGLRTEESAGVLAGKAGRPDHPPAGTGDIGRRKPNRFPVTTAAAEPPFPAPPVPRAIEDSSRERGKGKSTVFQPVFVVPECPVALFSGCAISIITETRARSQRKNGEDSKIFMEGSFLTSSGFEPTLRNQFAPNPWYS